MNNVTVRGRAIAAAIRPSGIQHTQNHNVTAVRLVPGLRLNKKKLKLLPYVRTFLNTFFFFFFLHYDNFLQNEEIIATDWIGEAIESMN